MDKATYYCEINKGMFAHSLVPSTNSTVEVYQDARYSTGEGYNASYGKYHAIEDAVEMLNYAASGAKGQCPIVKFSGAKYAGLAKTTAEIECKKRNHSEPDRTWAVAPFTDYHGNVAPNKFVVVGRLKACFDKYN